MDDVSGDRLRAAQATLTQTKKHFNSMMVSLSVNTAAWWDAEERTELTKHLATVENSLITASWHMRAAGKLIAALAVDDLQA
jgi:hypothetical protein